MSRNIVAVVNGKGGVLKTTLSAQLAGLTAARGWRVLAVDLDPQGNLQRDLGYSERSDEGAALLAAATSGSTPALLREVRKHLDVLPGGRVLKELNRFLQLQRLQTGVPTDDHLLRVLDRVAGDYDLVVVDCPPGEELLHAEVLRAARFVLIPTQPDDASIDGLAEVFDAYVAARSRNPDLEVLGVAIGPVGAGASVMRSVIRERLSSMLGTVVPVFPTMIRQSQAAAVQARNLGLLVHELELLKRNSPRWFELPKEERKKRSVAEAGKLAADYEALVGEIVARFHERAQASVAAHG